MKVTKVQLRRIIKEEKQKILFELDDHEMHEKDADLYDLGDYINNMIHYSTEASVLMEEMGMRYGELAALGTDARTVKQLVQKLADTYANKLDDIARFSE